MAKIAISLPLIIGFIQTSLLVLIIFKQLINYVWTYCKCNSFLLLKALTFRVCSVTLSHLLQCACLFETDVWWRFNYHNNSFTFVTLFFALRFEHSLHMLTIVTVSLQMRTERKNFFYITTNKLWQIYCRFFTTVFSGFYAWSIVLSIV